LRSPEFSGAELLEVISFDAAIEWSTSKTNQHPRFTVFDCIRGFLVTRPHRFDFSTSAIYPVTLVEVRFGFFAARFARKCFVPRFISAPLTVSSAAAKSVAAHYSTAVIATEVNNSIRHGHTFT